MLPGNYLRYVARGAEPEPGRDEGVMQRRIDRVRAAYADKPATRHIAAWTARHVDTAAGSGDRYFAGRRGRGRRHRDAEASRALREGAMPARQGRGPRSQCGRIPCRSATVKSTMRSSGVAQGFQTALTPWPYRHQQDGALLRWPHVHPIPPEMHSAYRERFTEAHSENTYSVQLAKTCFRRSGPFRSRGVGLHDRQHQ